MPHGDRTGPMGIGPQSGRRFGFCSGSGRPGFLVDSYGAGPGYAGTQGFRGTGYPGAWQGRGHRFFARGAFAAAPYGVPTKEEELAGLKDEASWLSGRLDAINRRIEELAE